jgi:hypothetical protein
MIGEELNSEYQNRISLKTPRTLDIARYCADNPLGLRLVPSGVRPARLSTTSCQHLKLNVPASPTSHSHHYQSIWVPPVLHL